MRYRLRTLMIVLSVLGVLFARIGYLKHKAESHRQRISKIVSRIVDAKENVANGVTSEMIERAVSVQLSDPTLWKQIGEAQQDNFRREAFLYMSFHHIMADRYDRAVYRPWRLVSETESE